MKSPLQLRWIALFLAAAIIGRTTARAADAPASAAELTILKAVPADAVEVVIINHLDVADAKLAKLVTTIGAPTGPGIREAFHILPEIKEGVDEKGTAAVVMLPKSSAADADVDTIFYLPMKDYKWLVANSVPEHRDEAISEIHVEGRVLSICHKGDFAAIAEGAGESQHKLLQHVLDDSTGIGPKFAALRDWIGDHDLSLLATSRGIKQGLEATRKSFQGMKTAMAANKQTAAAASVFESLDSLLEQAGREITTFGVGARVEDDGGLRVDSRAVFTPDGQFAATAKKIPLPTGIPMAGLPAGPFMVAFDGEMPEALSQSLMGFSLQVLKAAAKGQDGKDLTPEQTAKLKELMERSKDVGLRSMAMVMGVPRPGESMYGSTAAILRVADAHKYLDNYEKSLDGMREMQKILNNPLVQAPEVKKVTVEGLAGLEVTIDMSQAAAAAGGNPMQKKMMDSLFGPNGKLKAYLAAADDKTVVMAYVSQANFARTISAVKNPQTSLSADANVSDTAQMLWRDALWIGYVSPKGFMDFTMGMLQQMAPPGAMPQMPPFPDSPPAGIALAVSPGSLNAQVVLPAATLKATGGYFIGMSQMFMPQPQLPQPKRGLR